MAAIQDVTILTSATPVLDGTDSTRRPIYLVNEGDEVITLNFAGSTADRDLAPGEHLQVDPRMAITATVAAGTGLLQILRGVVPDAGAMEPSPAYDAQAGSLRTWRDNPERAYVLEQQEVASSQGDGAPAAEYYVDLHGYKNLSIQVQDTPGVAGTNTYKLYGSAEAGPLEDDAATYEDVGSLLFGAASWTTDAMIVNTKELAIRYLKIEVTRSGDAANTDGGWTIDIQGN